MFGVVLIIIAAVATPVKAINYDVASCAELADIDGTTVTSLTITSTPFECDSYTRFRVRNDMVLKSDSAVVFSNFALKVQGTLTVEPDVTFQDVTKQDTHGGALYVEKDSSATFLGKASFTRNSVLGYSRYRSRHGGAIFNKGELVFEGDAVFFKNEVPEALFGRGGAVYNARVGTITFNGKLTANENIADGQSSEQGGALYTSGTIVVNGESSFANNAASSGAAIHVFRRGTITFNDFATFTENIGYTRGGAIASFGPLNIMSGSLFQSNIAERSTSEGGGIYVGWQGSLTFNGDNTFDGNSAYEGGAIYAATESITPPADGGEIIYQNLRGEICPGFYQSVFRSDPICGP